ncbi:hypothetical protein [Streptomyces sp. NPDC002599]
MIPDREVPALPPEPVRLLCVDAYTRGRPWAVPHGGGPDEDGAGFA